MKINIEKALKFQASEFISDANFAYDEQTDELNSDNAHVIGQKILLRTNIIKTFLDNILIENDVQKNNISLTRKMLAQTEEDIDYMYPNGRFEEGNAHVVMQLIKRTGEDLYAFLDCFSQKNENEIEGKMNIVEILKKQFKEYDDDLNYAYPENNYDDDNGHIVLQGLLAKSEFLSYLLVNSILINEEEKEFKTIYQEKLSELLSLLNSGYNEHGYYLKNGHEIFSDLIEGLKVEIKDLEEIKLSDCEEIDNMNKNKKSVEIDVIPDIHGSDKELRKFTNNFRKEKEEEQNNKTIEMGCPKEELNSQVRNEEIKKKLKKIM